MSRFNPWFFVALLWAPLISGTQSMLQIGNRSAILYVPDRINNPALVISMHGIGIPASMNQGMMQFEKIADTANFIVVYPEAENLRWDLGGNKDVDYITAIIEQLVSRYGVDRHRVYASGFSMGGMMSWYLSCKIPDKIAAIVPGNGYPLGGMSECSEVRHVPALQIHGNADDFVSYANFVNSFLPTQRSRYGCPASPQKISPYPTEVNGRNASQLAQGSRSYLEIWSPCVKGGLTSELALLTVNGMIHDWATPNKANGNDDPAYKGKPFDVNGTWEAWNWMRSRTLNGAAHGFVPGRYDSVFNGRFDLGSAGWTFNVWGGTGQGFVSDGMYRIDVTAIGNNSYDIQLIQNGIVLSKGYSYQVSFDAYASQNRPLEVNVEMDASPWTSYLPELKTYALTTQRKAYAFDFIMEHATDSNSRLTFNVANSLGTVFLDNISIKAAGPVQVISGRAALAPRVHRYSETQVLVRIGEKEEGRRLRFYDLCGREMSLHARWHESLRGWLLDFASMPAGIYYARIDGTRQATWLNLAGSR